MMHCIHMDTSVIFGHLDCTGNDCRKKSCRSKWQADYEAEDLFDFTRGTQIHKPVRSAALQNSQPRLACPL